MKGRVAYIVLLAVSIVGLAYGATLVIQFIWLSATPDYGAERAIRNLYGAGALFLAFFLLGLYSGFQLYKLRRNS